MSEVWSPLEVTKKQYITAVSNLFVQIAFAIRVSQIPNLKDKQELISPKVPPLTVKAGEHVPTNRRGQQIRGASVTCRCFYSSPSNNTLASHGGNRPP